jgi:hypothetical protein
VAGWAQNDEANRVQSTALTSRNRQHSGWLGRRRRSEQRTEQRPQISCPPTQWLAKRAPKNRSEARGTPSPVVPASTVAGSAQADQANRGQRSAHTCRARHPSGCLSPRRTSKQRPEQCHYQSCPTPQRLKEPTPTSNRVHISALTCRARLHSAFLKQRRTSGQRPEQRPHPSCSPPQWLSEHTPTKRTQARATPSTAVPATTVPGRANDDQAN